MGESQTWLKLLKMEFGGMRGIVFIIILLVFIQNKAIANSFVIQANDPSYLELSFFSPEPKGGDTIFIASDRTKGITLIGLTGDEENPIVITNQNGLVNIVDPNSWSAFLFKNCQFIKLIGNGDSDSHYGFKLSAKYSGVNVGQNSTNFEIAFIEIDHEGFVGIQVKDDYGGEPPTPLPEFRKLVIHDCFIQNVTEGMYLGETKSPGLEFRYVRVFNNIVINTGREGIQLANMVEDVEVYNNFISGSGQDFHYAQGNNIQIGDNTVADIYNNILIGAEEFSVIIFGLGHINVYSNYMQNSNGIFIDNRNFTDLYSSFTIHDNYFLNIISNQIVLNYNELNKIIIEDNYYNSVERFYRSNCSDCDNVLLESNIDSIVLPLNYSGEDVGAFVHDNNNEADYLQMGPKLENSYSFNSWPEFDNLHDIFVNTGSISKDTIVAFTHDGDELKLFFENIPDFVSTTEYGNGVVLLNIDTQNQSIGKYQLYVTAIDQSHQVEIRNPFSIIVKAPDNKAPELNVGEQYEFYNLEKNTIPFDVFDPDLNEIKITLIDAPDFIFLQEKNSTEFELMIQPEYSDTGNFSFSIHVEDGFSGVVEKIVTVIISPKKLEVGTILYRINFGGPALNDEPINWEAGNENLDEYNYQRIHSTGSYSWKGSNQTTAPDSLFGPFTFIKPDTLPINFAFPCESMEYLVKLYFTERQVDFDSLGSTKMEVFSENNISLTAFVLDERLIDNALVKSFKVTVVDSILNINIIPIQNYVKINGLEISVAFPYDLDETVTLPFLFPNPFLNRLILLNNELDPVLEWEIYSLKGQLIKKGVNTTPFLSFIEIDTSLMQKGTYIISIITNTNRIYHKLVKG